MNRTPGMLFVINYPSNTGYAWDYFENLYARVADALSPLGVETFVAYPDLRGAPRTIRGSAAHAVQLDGSLSTTASVRAVIRFVRTHGIGLVYFTDRPTRNWWYGALRAAGVRRIVVADHTSGARTRPWGFKKALKWLAARLPSVNADHIVTPSDFVRRRQEEVTLNPKGRITRIYYGFEPLPGDPVRGEDTHASFGVDPDRPIVACACRAAPEKGVDHLFRAFDRALLRLDGHTPRPVLLYLGDGPYLPELKALRASLSAGDDIVLGGFRRGAVPLLRGAACFAVPSIWQDALPLAVLEPMAWGKPVIAARVGGIPEMVEDGESGLLVPPADEEALADTLLRVLLDPELGARLGRSARARVEQHFAPDRELRQMLTVVAGGGP